ncbi:hypothetical protein HKD37_16G045261 [Glycine soja]
MMEDNTAAIATTSAAIEADPTHPSGIIQISRRVPDVVGQGGEELGSTGNPHVVQCKNSFPPYNLPPNYTTPNAVHVPDKNTNHSAPVLLENQQPQLGHAFFAQPMGEAREEPQDHALDLVFVGKRIEVGLRRGKFDYAASTSTSNRKSEIGGAKKKEGDTHVITLVPTWLKSQQISHN